MEIRRIDHVLLAAPPGSEDEARRYFIDVLGLRELPKPDSLSGRGGCWFELGDQQVHVGVDPDFRPAVKGHVSFEVQGVRKLADHLAQMGYQVAWDDAIDGVVRFYSRDP